MSGKFKWNIHISARNRLGFTDKCLEALWAYTDTGKIDLRVFLFDNGTDKENQKKIFKYYTDMLSEGLIHTLIINSKDALHNAFGKAVSSNQFAYLQKVWPDADYMTILDNDVWIVDKTWTKKISSVFQAFGEDPDYADQIKVVSQAPGGICGEKEWLEIEGMEVMLGVYGGSGFWNVRGNFFEDVGVLNLQDLVGHDKKHDQEYWKLCMKRTKNAKYVAGINHPMSIHAGDGFSICNALTAGKMGHKEEKEQRLKQIEVIDKELLDMTLEEAVKKLWQPRW